MYTHKKLQSDAQIKEFVDVYIIQAEMARDYIHHLWHLNIIQVRRAKAKTSCPIKVDIPSSHVLSFLP